MASTVGFFRDPTNREMGLRMVDLFGRRADGSEFAAGIRLAPFQADGTTYVAAAVRDMSERRALIAMHWLRPAKGGPGESCQDALSRDRKP